MFLRCVGILVAAASAFIAPTSLSTAHGSPADFEPAPSKAELTSLILAQRAMVPGLQSVVVQTRVSGSSPGLPDRVEQRVAISGGRALLMQRVWDEGEWFRDVPSEPNWYVTAEDGHKMFASNGEIALCTADRADIGGSAIVVRSVFLAALGWLPPAGAAVEGASSDVLGLLASPEARVLPWLEEVDGAMCAVVECQVNDVVVDRAWLDRDHGWLPRLRRIYEVPDGAEILERRVQSFSLFGDAVWLPTSTLFSVQSRPPLFPTGSVMLAEVVTTEPEWPVSFGADNNASFDDVCGVATAGSFVDRTQATATPALDAAPPAAALASGLAAPIPPQNTNTWWRAILILALSFAGVTSLAVSRASRSSC